MTCIEGAVIAGLDKIGDVVRKNWDPECQLVFKGRNYGEIMTRSFSGDEESREEDGAPRVRERLLRQQSRSAEKVDGIRENIRYKSPPGDYSRIFEGTRK